MPFDAAILARNGEHYRRTPEDAREVVGLLNDCLELWVAGSGNGKTIDSFTVTAELSRLAARSILPNVQIASPRSIAFLSATSPQQSWDRNAARPFFENLRIIEDVARGVGERP